MKQVIFFCILSISMCLSASVPTVASSSVAPEPDKHEAVTGIANVTEKIPAATNASQPIPTNNNQTIKENTTSSTPPPKDDKVKPTEKPSSEVSPTVSVPTNTTSPVAPTTPPASSAIPTVKPEPDHKSTVTPKTIEPAHALQARGFDGASFVGGIILTLGLLAIGFMGFKYYKNQTERNYHTL